MHQRRPPDGIILGLDNPESPTHGQQEGSAWTTLFVFNHFGDREQLVQLGLANAASLPE